MAGDRVWCFSRRRRDREKYLSFGCKVFEVIKSSLNFLVKKLPTSEKFVFNFLWIVSNLALGSSVPAMSRCFGALLKASTVRSPRPQHWKNGIRLFRHLALSIFRMNRLQSKVSRACGQQQCFTMCSSQAQISFHSVACFSATCGQALSWIAFQQHLYLRRGSLAQCLNLALMNALRPSLKEGASQTNQLTWLSQLS